MENNIQENWERFLNPNELRSNMILAAIYIAAFEILKNSIIERIRDFYITGFDTNDWIVDPKYKESVLSRNKSPLYASLNWLKESKVITDEDIKVVNKVKETRNLLAHEITKMLAEGLPSNFVERFDELVFLLDKIEKWWIVNVEIPINPDLAGMEDEIDEDEIIPGPNRRFTDDG